MCHGTRFSVGFETALCLFIPFHVLNSLVPRLNQTGAAQTLIAKSKHLRQVSLKLKSKLRETVYYYGCTQKLHDTWKQAHKYLFWSVDTLQQPKENDDQGCMYKFKETKTFTKSRREADRKGRNQTRNLGF
jgi:hypothetical protein